MKPKGGPAFPLTDWKITDLREGAFEHAGMTLRDYFAARAMQGALSSPHILKMDGKQINGGDSIADFAYSVADAMLAERDK